MSETQTARTEHQCAELPKDFMVSFDHMDGLMHLAVWKLRHLGLGASKVLAREIKFCPFCGDQLVRRDNLGLPMEAFRLSVNADMSKCQIPDCFGHVKEHCSCHRSDSKCSEGHEYHFQKTAAAMMVHVGMSNHGSSERCCQLASQSA